jgi:hypothetical protein
VQTPADSAVTVKVAEVLPPGRSTTAGVMLTTALLLVLSVIRPPDAGGGVRTEIVPVAV